MVFNLTRAQFEAKRKQLAAGGIAVPAGDTGEISAHGIVASFAFVEPNLQLAIKHKPFGVPESMIDDRLKAWFSV